jgi:hypothetical protein
MSALALAYKRSSRPSETTCSTFKAGTRERPRVTISTWQLPIIPGTRVEYSDCP